MNTTKKINVNFSSLVGLKAELLRKQTEIKDAKAKEDGQPKVAKPKVKSKKPKEKKVKVEPGYTEIEDIATLKRSKVMLEAKTMLYDRLKKSGGDETTQNYLVDFANKSDESEAEIYREEDYEDANSDPEDDWVEYRDCFGRTRKCLRRDLPKMREKDDLVKRDITKEPALEEQTEQPSEVTIPIPEKEPEIEIMRKKWEEQMERLADKTDIHYQDVLFDEARAHGVGYYAFSQNDEERARQQENLAKLRKETEQRQRESQEVRDLKSKMELNRLRAATIRQRVRSGLSAELSEEEEATLKNRVTARNSNETPEEETSPEVLEAKAKNAESEKDRIDNSLIVVEDKIKAFAELLGKRPKWHEMSQEEWVYKRRKDRLGEFAPVYENFRRGDSFRGTRDNQIIPRDENKGDPLRISASGPEPTDLWETDGPSYKEEKIKDEQSDSKAGENLEISTVPEIESVQVIEDNDEEESLIGPFPPDSAGTFVPPTFINSFVPQPMSIETQMPVSFVRSVTPSPMINFSIPPPSIVHPPPKLLNSVESREEKYSIEDENSSDSDSIVIGPVPPPSIDEFTSSLVQNCGPSLIDNNHINMLSDIPLPATVQFPPTHNFINLPAISVTHDGRVEETSDTVHDTETSGNLDVNKISAGLKYLREKFDKTSDS